MEQVWARQVDGLVAGERRKNKGLVLGKDRADHRATQPRPARDSNMMIQRRARQNV